MFKTFDSFEEASHARSNIQDAGARICQGPYGLWYLTKLINPDELCCRGIGKPGIVVIHTDFPWVGVAFKDDSREMKGEKRMVQVQWGQKENDYIRGKDREWLTYSPENLCYFVEEIRRTSKLN
jgi:hypothetical protein